MTEQQRYKDMNKKRSYARKMLRAEIEEAKAKVRAAYTLKLKQEEGHELTPEELEIVDEAPVNQKFTEKLEAMLARQSKTAEKINTFHDDDVWTLLRFFYLARLAQQGFFYLIAGVYPFLEPQAITFLCDKMVGSTLYASRASFDAERKHHREMVREIVRKLHLELDEPVAEGFKTTYKQIMHAIHSLADQSVAQQQPQSTDQEDEDEESSQKPTAQPQIQPIPPIWVVMPYASMMDGSSFALPGSIPTLPYPTTMLPMGLPMTYPTMQHPDHKKRANGRKDQKKKNNRNKKDKQQQRHEEDEESKQDEEENRQEENEDKQEDEYNYEDDRFADAETTDEEEVNEPQAQDESQAALVDSAPQASQADSAPVTPIAPVEAQPVVESNHNLQEHQYQDIEHEQPKSQEVNTANSSWRNFAASSTVDVETNSPTSPRSNGSPRTAKSKRYTNNKY